MYIEHFQLDFPPFAESINLEIFFPGSRREEICQSLILDILAGKPLLKLIGREGSGKTLICRLMAQRLPVTHRVVAFSHPIGSFDDLLRVVCLDLESEPTRDQTALYGQVQGLLAGQRARGVRVVLLIDEAEHLFLATLERLVRHVGDGIADLDCTLVLVGRPGLDANLAQMAAVSTAVEFSGSYELAELSESETRQYLRYRVTAAGMSRERFAEVFSEGVLNRICSNAKGNPRLINILAEETLRNCCAEKSFMVLLDHVEPESVVRPASASRLAMLADLLSANRRLTAALAGLMVLVLIFGVALLRPNGQSTAPHPVVEGNLAGPTITATTSAPSPSVSAAQVDGEAIFRERLGAGASWVAGMYKGAYTIQLMMLSAPNAQATLAATLASDSYAPVRDQLYILNKRTTPPTLFVFYGVYDSLDAAREARNGMPAFLRKHQPYPLSITEAMTKLEQ
jgi:type II secretory pathway predicted ATPase ExeA